MYVKVCYGNQWMQQQESRAGVKSVCRWLQMRGCYKLSTLNLQSISRSSQERVLLDLQTFQNKQTNKKGAQTALINHHPWLSTLLGSVWWGDPQRKAQTTCRLWPPPAIHLQAGCSYKQWLNQQKKHKQHAHSNHLRLVIYTARPSLMSNNPSKGIREHLIVGDYTLPVEKYKVCPNYLLHVYN